MSLRVIQWATGRVGYHALRSIMAHPELELVGVRVYSDAKNGVDAGELCGLPTLGVKATTDVDSLLALDADCVCVTALEADGVDPIVEDLTRILRSGKNVVMTSLTGLVFPSSVPAMYGDANARLEAACQEGGTSVYVSGIHPGFMMDLIPAILSSGCRQIERISLAEHFDISQLNQPEILRDWLGFGLPPEVDEQYIQVRHAVSDAYWSSSLKLLAHALKVELDELRPRRDVVLADEPFEVAGLHIEKGTVAGVRCGFDGIVGGQVRLSLTEYIRGAPHVAPEWPPSPAGGGHRVRIEGTPNIDLDISFPSDDPINDGFIFTAQRVVSAIPTVCAAAPGLHTFLSLGQPVTGTATW